MLTFKLQDLQNDDMEDIKKLSFDNFQVISKKSIDLLLDPSSGGSEPLFMELTDIYLREMPNRLLLLSGAIAKNDLSEIEHQAHKIRGGSAYLGAIGISQIAQTLERAAVEKRDVDGPGLFAQLEKLFVESVAEVERLRTQLLRQS